MEKKTRNVPTIALHSPNGPVHIRHTKRNHFVTEADPCIVYGEAFGTKVGPTMPVLKALVKAWTEDGDEIRAQHAQAIIDTLKAKTADARAKKVSE